ncbi:MAG: RluA family pseudouridine synthase [Bauldia sp.]|nr:RluA family pseudouridine synthase [Bauldia sp.]
MAGDEGGTTRTVTVAEERAGMRLDAFLPAAVEGLSRVRAKALILDGHVTIDGRAVREAKHGVRTGETVAVTLPPPEPAEPEGEAIPLDIVYEDDDLIVIDKPAGLVVHPAPGHSGGTLVNALIAHCGDSLSGIGGVRRPGIVHRLDKETTGLLVAAKNDAAHRGLAAQFAEHGRDGGSLVRGYKAIVWGVPTPLKGTVEAAIGRSTKNRKKMAIAKDDDAHAREAVTHYVVDAVFGPKGAPIASLLSLELETGRTHQIRVHLAAIGHPVMGDPEYGAGMATKAAKLPEPAQSLVRALHRQALHAFLLGFEHPVTGEAMEFEAEPPADMAAIIAALRDA